MGTTTLGKKALAVGLALTTVLWLSGVAAFVPRAHAQSVADIQAQIATLLAQIQALQAQLNAAGGAPVTACNFTRDLTVGVTGDDVKCLQQYLNGAGFSVASSGAGSPGNETTYFGSRTKQAVSAWQAANSVSPTAGYFGSRSRAKYSALAVTTPPPTPPTPPGTPPPPTPPGTGVAVARSADQPTPGLHPDNAVRVLYTCVDFTASADGDATVDSVTVERRGASTDATFSGVVLVNDRDVQIGVAKTLNSNHQATLSEDFKVEKGTTKKMCVAGNRTTGGSNGTTASFAVVSVAAKAGATVSGTFPIVGITHTINVSGLTIGTATVETGPAKSVATTTEDIGKHVVFTATKVSAGSTEDIRINFFRWNQVGTAGSGDIANVMVKVDSTEYPVAVASDGKYYTADFYPGIVVTKGNSAEVKIEGDLLRSNRTYQMDIQKSTDMGFRGELYGYGLNPTNSTGFTTTEPVYWAANFTTRKGGTINIEKDSAVTAQNIAVNVSEQPIGGFIVDVKGEPISVGSMVFRIAPTNVAGGTTETAADVTQVKLLGPNGILAGPVDGVAAGTATFSDTVTFPLGKTSVKLVGKLGTAFDSNDTISASTTPGTNFTTVTGQDSNETITPTPSSAVVSNVMTIKAGALTLSVASTPVAQTVVSGVNQFAFAIYQFDATQSGEDIRFTTIPLAYQVHAGGTATNLTSCQLYDGATSRTSGSNVVNPSSAGSSTSFTFDGTGFVIPKGTTKNLDMKCNIAGGASGPYSWGIASTASFSPVGLTSGQTISPTVNTSSGQKMTLSSGGSYTVTNNSTPGYRIVNSGATGVTLLRLRFAALDEDISLQRIGFNLGTGNNPLTGVASNTPIDLVNSEVKIYDEAAPTVLLGTAQFTNNADFATSSLLVIPGTGTSPSTSFIIPRGSFKDLVVKGDTAMISASGPLERSGDLLTVNFDGDAKGINGGNYGTGQSSGTNIAPTTVADTNIGGVRILKAYPEFTKIDLTATERALTVNANQVFYKFSVKAVGGDVHLFKFTFNIASSTFNRATTSLYSLYAYQDSTYGTIDTTAPGNGSLPGLFNGGQCVTNAIDQDHTVDADTASNVGLHGSDFQIFATSDCLTGTTTYKVPSGATRYFVLKANAARNEEATQGGFPPVGAESLVVVLRGDAAWPVDTDVTCGPNMPGNMAPAGVIKNAGATEGGGQCSGNVAGGVMVDTNDDFIWSPASTSTSPTVNDLDFTNGYQVVGLPASDMAQETISATSF